MTEKGKIQIIKYAPPPPQLPVLGKIDPADVCFFGKTNYVAALEKKEYIFGIKRKDRLRHMYVVGKSGVGKSKFLELLIRQDIAFGKGVCLLDPHGDIIDDIIDFIPKNRIDDVCIINPADKDFPASFNPLANTDPQFKHQLTSGLIEVLEKQFGANWTPRLEHVFRFTTLALLDYPYATMRGMISMLTDRNYRQKVIEHIEDDMVKRFWAIEFADWSEKFDTDAIIPLVNKLGQFLSDPMLRNIFGQKENKIDLGELMDNEKIILINLSKGRLGEENSSFFGAMFLTKIKQAGMARAMIPEEDRKTCYLYADEFQNIVTETFENLLSEARKYGLALTIAHQYINQLLPKVQSAIFGNAATIVAFRVSGEDAIKLESEFNPIFKVKDMINLGKKEFYIKMTIDGESYDPFSASTLFVREPTHKSYREEIIESSRKKYTVNIEDTKKLILEEEATISRSADEKAIISGQKKEKKVETKETEKDNNEEDNIKEEVKEESTPLI